MISTRTALPIKSAYSKQMFLHFFFLFTSIWSERYSIGFKCLCITRVSDHLKTPWKWPHKTETLAELCCGVPLRLAELPFDFLLLLHMALSFYLFLFFFIKKTKQKTTENPNTTDPASALSTRQYPYPVDVEGTSGIGQRGGTMEQLQGRRQRGGSSPSAMSPLIPTPKAGSRATGWESWEGPCRRTLKFRSVPDSCWPTCCNLNGVSDFSLAQGFNIKAKIRHSVEAPSNLWHNSNDDNNKKNDCTHELRGEHFPVKQREKC